MSNTSIIEKNHQKSYSLLLAKIVILMLFGFIVVDMLNGYLMMAGYSSIAIIYKLLALFFASLYLLAIGARLPIFGITALFSVYLMLHTFILGNPIEVMQGLDWIIKFSAIVIWYLFFKKMIEQNQDKKILLFVYISFGFLTLNFFLAFLGFGFPMYSSIDGDGIGTKGFIFAGNEIGATIIISGALIQMSLLERQKYFLFFVIGSLMLFMGALLTSKVSIFASLLILLFFPLIKTSEKLRSLKINKKDFAFASLILFLLPLLAAYVISYALYESGLIERMNYFYTKLDIVTLLFSHRNVWASEALEAFYNHYSMLEIFIGSGNTWYPYITENKMVEIDLIDFLMSYGIIGILFSYGFLLFILYKLIHKRKTNPYFGYIFFMIFLIIGMSLTSGHILNSGVAGAFIGALFAISTYQHKGN